MMSKDEADFRVVALNEFDQARSRARRKHITDKIAGREETLLPFDAIRAQLRQQNPLYRGIQVVELDKIVGSVGRYLEFTRNFLPLNESLRERWVGVSALARTRGWPPIELYQIGDAYFVRDGNHRVSVARQMEIPSIEAHVWEFPVRVPVAATADYDEILITLEMSAFMEETALDELVPDHTLRLTVPGRYGEILAQIHDLRHKLSQIDEEEMSFESAVKAWYEMIYLPTIQIIHDARLLEAFPGRTEADLFVWLSIHRSQLGDVYGEFNSLADLATLLADRFGEKSSGKIARQVKQLLGKPTAAPLEEPTKPVVTPFTEEDA